MVLNRSGGLLKVDPQTVRTFFVVVVGCIGGGNYGILIVMFVELRVARSRHNEVVGRLVPAPF